MLGLAQATLNRWVADSSAARDELAALEGRSMVVAIDNTSWRIELAVDRRKLRLRRVDATAEADIEISGGAFELVGLLRAESEATLRAGEVEFRGSVRIADGFSRMLRLARPRLEDELAGWIGAMPASVFAGAGNSAVAWGEKTAAALELDTLEYLQAESRELPYRGEIEAHHNAVERLRDDVDRIAQRIEKLAQRSRYADSI